MKSRRVSSLVAVTLFLILAVVQLSVFGAGQVDPTFNPSMTWLSGGYVNSTLIQPDGKFVIVGLFRSADGEAGTGIARYNSDSTIDLTFRPPDFYSGFGYVGQNGLVLRQSTGKILVVGDIFGIDGVANNRPFVRLNSDGSLDSSFNPTGSLLAVMPDDRILVNSGNTLKVLTADGAIDPTLQFPGVTAVDSFARIQPDGKILCECTYNGTAAIHRFNTDGSIDNIFSPVVVNALDLDIQADGKIVIVGTFVNYLGFPIRGVMRVNSNGILDTGFNTGGTGADGGPNSAGVYAVSIAPNGMIAIGGAFSTYDGFTARGVAQLGSDGSLALTIPGNPLTTVYDVAFQPDNKLVISTIGGGRRQNTNGSLDLTYRNVISADGYANRVRVLPDGKVIAAGKAMIGNNENRFAVARFNASGSLDTTFVPALQLNSDQFVADMDVQADGKVLLAGRLYPSSANRGFVRLNTDGTVDLVIGFADGNFVMALPGGKFMFGNSRYNADGSLDTTFNMSFGSSGGSITEAVVQPDGKMIFVGTFTEVNGQLRGRIVRINSDGSLDPTFTFQGGANAAINDVVLQPDGKIVIGGDFTGVNFDTNKKYIARLNSDGSLDNSFTAAVTRTVLALRQQADGKIIFGETVGQFEFNPQAVGRLNSNGSLDASFSIGPGANGAVNDIDIQADGNVLIAGKFIRVNGESAVSLARLLNPAVPTRTPFDYDGDSRADISVFRPSENKWYVVRSSDSTVYQPIFAVAGDVPTPADYDGDGKTDVAIFRPSSGDWWYLSTVDGTQRTIHWGASGDVPRPSDFDGDGKADVIVFRPSDNNWYRSGSTGAVSIINFGLAGDKPVTGDFDGDGKSDVAIYRPSTGDWWYRSSINGAQLATHFGIATDTPAPADYDGDGRTDFAVYRASTGTWYILNSSNGQAMVMNFGIAEDKPVAADYDGDGKADIAVFRPSTGVWYLNRSTAGFFSMQFGVSTDVPTPNAFVP